MVARNSGWALLAAYLVISLALFRLAEANSDLDALTALRQSLSDPNNVLSSWDPSLVDPCTWFYVTCQYSQVTQVNLPPFANLSGHLVPELGNIQSLQYLNFHNNDLQGTIPSELGNMKSMIAMDLSYNRLTGTIPPSLGNMKHLQELWLQNNQLTGEVPQEIKDIPGIRIVNVTGNPMHGG